MNFRLFSTEQSNYLYIMYMSCQRKIYVVTYKWLPLFVAILCSYQLPHFTPPPALATRAKVKFKSHAARKGKV